MAQTYSNTPVLSKIQLPGVNTPYYLKDADARAIIDTLKSAAFLDADANITEGAQGVAKTSAIKAYVDSAIKIGVTVVKVDTLPTASAETEGKIYIVPQSGGKTSDNFDEYITIKSGSEYSWEKIGDTRIDLSNYVTDVSYADGTHTLSQTKNGTASPVHTFGALADKSSVAVQYDKATGGSVTYNAFSTATFVGEAGNVSVSVTEGEHRDIITNVAGNTVYYKLNTDDYKTSVVPSYSAEKNENAITLTVSGGTVSDGTAASLGDQATATFAQTGIVASVGTGVDAETLIFATASTATAVTPGLYTNFSAGTPTQVTLPDTATIDANSVVVDITGAATVNVLNGVSITSGGDSNYDIAAIGNLSVGSTNTLGGTFTPSGSVNVTTTPTVTTSVTITTTPTSATVDIQ